MAQCIVMLAGGVGSRIEPVAKGRPKLLLEVGGLPFLSLKMNEFERNGIACVLLLTGRGAGEIDQELERREFKIPVASLRDGPQLRGTGGALKYALPFLPDFFFLTYGDTLLDMPYGLLSEFAKSDPRKRSALAICKPQPGVDSQCNTRVENGVVVSHNKEDTKDKNFIDYGLSLLNKKDLVRAFRDVDGSDLSHVYGRLAELELLRGFTTNARYLEIGTPESYQMVDRVVIDRR